MGRAKGNLRERGRAVGQLRGGFITLGHKGWGELSLGSREIDGSSYGFGRGVDTVQNPTCRQAGE